MSENKECISTTRRSLIASAITGLAGLIVGVIVGSQALPRRIAETVTEVKTVTSMITTTVTETITHSFTETSTPTQTITPSIPEELKEKFQELLPGSSIFIPVTKNDEIVYYKALSTDGSLLGYVFETKAYGPTDILIVYGAIDPLLKVIAIDVDKAPEATYLFNPDIATPEFEDQFKGLGVDDLALKPEGKIDAVTGATLSSGAVAEVVKAKIELISEIEQK